MKDISAASPEGSLLGLPQVAELLGVHYMTAYRYVRTGRLSAGSDERSLENRPRRLASFAARSPASGRTVGGSRSRAVSMIEGRLLKGDEAGAFAVVENALASWATPGDVLTELIAPAMAHIGDLWKSKEITIADEHQAAGVATRIIGRLGPRLAHRGRHRGTVVVGAPAGDRHGIPSAIVADLLREVGFKVVDLGSDTPRSRVRDAAADADRLLAVGIGSTLPGNSRAVSATASALHRLRPDVPVIAGGATVPSERLPAALERTSGLGPKAAVLCGAGPGRGFGAPDHPSGRPRIRKVVRACMARTPRGGELDAQYDELDPSVATTLKQ